MLNKHLMVLLLTSTFISIGPRNAEAVDLKMYGALILSPVCKINNDDEIIVDFGSDLLTDKVDGVNYLKVVPYKIICSGGAGAASLYLSVVSSSVASFDSSAVDTNISGLAVSLALDNTPLIINEARKLSGSNAEPELTAVLVKKPGTTLSAGMFFTKTAVLQASYQ